MGSNQVAVPITKTHPGLLGSVGGGYFDALEIWNRSSRRLYEEVRRDWFSLLDRGIVRTATANTDTHTVASRLAGYPLNIVFLPEKVPNGAAVRPQDLIAAVRAGHLVGTDGPVPLLTVTAGPVAVGPGELLSAAPDGRVRIQVEILTASWVPAGEIAS